MAEPPILADQTFDKAEKLYRRFSADDLGPNQRVLVGALRFPDCSFNRSRHSKPEDVLSDKHPRENGVASIEVGKVPPRIESEHANPQKIKSYDVKVVHDPDYGIPPNFAHTEIRTAEAGMPCVRGNKMSAAATKKLRQLIADEMRVEVTPTPFVTGSVTE